MENTQARQSSDGRDVVRVSHSKSEIRDKAILDFMSCGPVKTSIQFLQLLGHCFHLLIGRHGGNFFGPRIEVGSLVKQWFLLCRSGHRISANDWRIGRNFVGIAEGC